MTDRERLINVVKDSLTRNIGKSCKLAENIVDDILANGVIVPQPKRGGKEVYTIKFRVGNYHITKYHDRFEVVFSPYQPIGKTMTFKKFSCNPTEKGGGSDA